MEYWQERLLDEHAQLCDRLMRLSALIVGESPGFAALDEEDKRLLRHQRMIMLDYSEVLQDRINRLKL